MFKLLDVKKQLINERHKNEQLIAALRKYEADTEYLAMMCGVELDMDNNDIQEVENNESEV